MFNLIPRPGIRLGSYPQKKDNNLSVFEQRVARIFQHLQHKLDYKQNSQQYVVDLVNRYQQPLKNYSETELSQAIQEIRNQLHQQGLRKPLIVKSFAIIREVAHRTISQRHYDVQLHAGWLMINGVLAEMETGEGKTLATTLASCTAALAGIPVHVITANDYLASRDCEMMTPLYHRLGLSSGAVTETLEKDQRSVVYNSNIVHSTNKQITFDYLRDRIEIGSDTDRLSLKFQQLNNELNNKHPLLLRGLCFALVDEADSILIDEAKTPLIITKNRPNEELAETFHEAFSLTSTLSINQDYTVNSRLKQIELTQDGENNLVNLVKPFPDHWSNKRKRETRAIQALAAKYFYKKNKHYIVTDDKVQIVDEFTGRIMADRSWEQGLHQMIEAKEGCLISEQREPLARISYQRFFSRYLRLGGTSGTLKEVSAEIQRVYGLHTVKVKTNRPSKRAFQSESIYRNTAIKKQVLLKRIHQLYQQHRPILIGTSSVEESEQVSQWLEEGMLPYRLLNAKQDKDEANIIAQAGHQQTITVATNMAGRGTDIKLDSSVIGLGGLHIIALSLNDSRRIDRQLYGRCGRQGEPGSAEAILSLEDPALAEYYSSAMLKLIEKLCSDTKPLADFIGKIVLRLPQQKNENNQSRIRKSLMKQDRHLQKILAFSGKFE